MDELAADPKVKNVLLLSEALDEAARLHGFVTDDKADRTAYKYDEIIAFFRDRLLHSLPGSSGLAGVEGPKRLGLVRAVLASGFDDIPAVGRRLRALASISASGEWEKLVELVERTFKIGRGADLTGSVRENLLQEEQEKEVWRVLQKESQAIRKLFSQGRYEEGSLAYCRALAGPVHEFFDKVFVNVEDLNVRRNRMLLMRKVFELYAANVADLSLVPGGAEG
jgi:glycyl-tRNA synthetase beta chain